MSGKGDESVRDAEGQVSADPAAAVVTSSSDMIRSRLPPPGSTIADKYRLEVLIGEGGMGAVFRATHLLMNKPVALKWLSPLISHRPEAHVRFIQEARVTMDIHHPNVVRVFDVGVHEGNLFMVMELLKGDSLQSLLQANQLPTRTLLELLIQATEGVAAAHEHGVIHRDIKPANIFVENGSAGDLGRVRVLDFGISKVNNALESGSDITRTGSLVGTPIYMPLEQLRNSREVDERVDIYALGVVAYQALTGRVPFKGDTFVELSEAIAGRKPVPLSELRPDLPREFNETILKAIAREPHERHASAYHLLTALQELQVALSQHGSTGPVEAIPAEPASRPPLGAVLRWFGGGLLVALVIAGLAYWGGVGGWRPQPAPPRTAGPVAVGPAGQAAPVRAASGQGNGPAVDIRAATAEPALSSSGQPDAGVEPGGSVTLPITKPNAAQHSPADSPDDALGASAQASEMADKSPRAPQTAAQTTSARPRARAVGKSVPASGNTPRARSPLARSAQTSGSAAAPNSVGARTTPVPDSAQGERDPSRKGRPGIGERSHRAGGLSLSEF